MGRNDEKLLRSQRALFEHLKASEIMGDDDAARILGVDDSTVSRWRTGTRGAPIGVLDQLLAALPPDDVAEVLRRYALRHGSKAGKRVVVEVLSERDDGGGDGGGLTDDVLELTMSAGDLAREARAGDDGKIVAFERAQRRRDRAEAAERAARRIRHAAEGQLALAFDGRRQVR